MIIIIITLLNVGYYLRFGAYKSHKMNCFKSFVIVVGGGLFNKYGRPIRIYIYKSSVLSLRHLFRISFLYYQQKINAIYQISKLYLIIAYSHGNDKKRVVIDKLLPNSHIVGGYRLDLWFNKKKIEETFKK